jgi:outer membrane protein assembly factor BamB
MGAAVMVNRPKATMRAMAALVILALFLCRSAAAEDWPTRLYDKHRSGITSESLTLPLTERWTYDTARRPAPAWTESPAPHDHYRDYYNLKPRQNFDFAFDVAVAGNFVYFGSSRSGTVNCLNAATGDTVWTFFTEGPVRLCPTVAGGRVYVGSDDGCVYCLDALTGARIWSERVGGEEMIWGNGQMISVWPVRSSVLVDGSDVFWAAGLFPEEEMYLCKRSAATGSGGWTVTPQLPPQGYLLATAGRLFVPSGKTYPTMYQRTDGAYVGHVQVNTRDGGCWALLTPSESYFWTGPTVENHLRQFNAQTAAQIATVNGANYLVADDTYAYCCTDTQIMKLQRGNGAILWSVDHAYPYALIKAGATLFAGGDGEIAAFVVATARGQASQGEGTRLWTAPVKGKAYGLAVANGALYASTDAGTIHCFRSPASHAP